MTSLFLEPLDVLYLRGNKLFADAGAHGEALMPPWPSLAAGAIRSRLMAEGASLGSLGDFRLSQFGLARLHQGETVEHLWPLPADVVVSHETDLADATYLRPCPTPPGIASSHALPKLPTLQTNIPGKPVTGLWLTGAGIAGWSAGQPLNAKHFARSGDLWQTDPRLGIALDPKTRSAADGKIYTTETIALKKGIGFFAAYEGSANNLPAESLVRLGGDGRGAVVRSVSTPPTAPDWARIEKEGRFRLMLTTPGLFSGGWRPDGVPATLVAASVSRAETISGWDLVTNKPKPAQRVAPTGSVYWFENYTGDLATLKALAHNGFPIEDPARYAEGFGKLAIAPWAL
ncbi:MAG: type III-B CRISPR module-associated Cmr3 family protein [Betaproteobacteria bacterium]